MTSHSEMPRCGCGAESAGPMSLCEAVHEMMCSACAEAWRASTERRLFIQLLQLGRLADALSQFRSFQALASARVAA